MPLDRKAVDDTSGRHIQQMREMGHDLSDAEKREIRKLHEKMARTVEGKKKK